MTRLALADLRDSWVSWLGVALAFITTNAALALSVIQLTTAQTSTTNGHFNSDESSLLSAYGAMNIALSSLVGLAVIGASTSLVVTARRGSLARLALAGATPRQVTGLLAIQIAFVALLAGIVGDVVTLVAAQPMIDAIASDRELPNVTAAVPPLALVATNLACITLSLLGGLRQARAAGKIPPVEALRDAAAGGIRREGRVRTALRGARFLVFAGALAAAFPGFRAAAPELGDDAMQTVMKLTVVAIPLTGLALTAILPWICGGLTRLWTSALPIPGPAWHLARLTVIAKSDRLVRSIVPIMFAVGLLFGMMCVTNTLIVALARLGITDLEGTSATTMLSTTGLPLAIAIAGSIGNIVMMSGQRSAELALTGIVGATPRQQVLVPIFEAVILTVTASLLGLVMAVVSAGLLTYGLGILMPGSPPLSIPWEVLGWSVLVCLASVTLAAVIPVLRSLQQPAPRVIARLVAA